MARSRDDSILRSNLHPRDRAFFNHDNSFAQHVRRDKENF